MDRDSNPLSPRPMSRFVEAVENLEKEVKRVTVLVMMFTGIRAHTCAHLQADWLFYDDKGRLVIDVPHEYKCPKNNPNEMCCDCNKLDKNETQTPKTTTSARRQLTIPETWYDFYNDIEKELNLRRDMEHYFDMGDGVGKDYIHATKGTMVKYCCEAARNGDIGPYRDTGYKIHRDLGRVPDVFNHDMRATFGTQAYRGTERSASQLQIAKKMGHASTDSTDQYVRWAEEESQGNFVAEYI